MAKAPQSKNLVSNPLLKKLIAASDSKHISTIKDSKILNGKDMIHISVPAMNIALSGDVDGGLIPGMIQIAGPSKHFKTLFMMVMMKSYLDKYPDAVGYLFDSEFGAALNYFTSLGIDGDRVIHNPITSIEHLKHEASVLLETIDRGDKVFIAIDSVGNLASKKEIEDAIDNKAVADMTRAKALKSFGRIVTPHLTIKDVPMVIVNHTYKTLEMYSKDTVGGGTGLYYSSNDIWIIGRNMDRDTGGEKEVLGYHFIINIEKSRTVKEKSRIPVYVGFNTGIDKYSGLLDLGKEAGIITGDGKSGYDYLGKKYDTEKDLVPVFEKWLVDDNFKSYVKDKFRLKDINLLNADPLAGTEEE